MQTLLKRGCSGTILSNISKAEFQNIPLPAIDCSVQNEVRKNVNHSNKLRLRSKELLECAKKAVEMAIEQNEATATAWLNNKIKYLTLED